MTARQTKNVRKTQLVLIATVAFASQTLAHEVKHSFIECGSKTYTINEEGKVTWTCPGRLKARPDPLLPADLLPRVVPSPHAQTTYAWPRSHVTRQL